jgi:3-isopropylmalate/(R)-2-methylmalate dehydratase large subunit
MPIMARASGKDTVRPGETVWVRPDVNIWYDFPPMLPEMFMKVMRDQLKIKVVDPQKVHVFIDHMVPSGSEAETIGHNKTIEWCKEEGMCCHAYQIPGIGHQVSAELGLARPGEPVINGDTHVQLFGAFGALTLSVIFETLTLLALG